VDGRYVRQFWLNALDEAIHTERWEQNTTAFKKKNKTGTLVFFLMKVDDNPFDG
jgi:hypothetical protein